MTSTSEGSTPLSSARIRLALLALTLGGFGLGCTEFVALGLLPNLAADLLPAAYAASPEQANGQAGLLVTAYAAGVVVGAPTIAAVVARWPRKNVLVCLLSAIVLSTLASALLPTFGLVVAARFVSGLPHGAFFGIAALVAGSLMGPGKRGRGVALVLGGLTVANVVGVPFVTFVGQTAGWRTAYVVVAAMFVIALVAVILAVPNLAGDKSATMRKELTALGRPQVWLTIGIGAIGFGGFFCVYTYVSPVVTTITGLPENVVPWALVAVGLGMTVGNLIGGWAADHNLKRSMILFFLLLMAALAELVIFVTVPVGLFIGLFVVGVAASALSPLIQTRLMNVAGESQSIAAALNHSALNFGNALGPVLGGLALSAGLGYIAPIWVGIVLSVLGLTIALAAFWFERRGRRQSAKTSVSGYDAVGEVSEGSVDAASTPAPERTEPGTPSSADVDSSAAKGSLLAR